MWLLLPELLENPVKGGPSRTVTVPLASKRFSFSQDTFRKFRNGTKIVWESFLNIRKWLPFRNADHSIENFGGSRKDIPENLCLPYEVHLSQKFRKMLFHSPLEISGNSTRNFLSNGKAPRFRKRPQISGNLHSISWFSRNYVINHWMVRFLEIKLNSVLETFILFYFFISFYFHTKKNQRANS